MEKDIDIWNKFRNWEYVIKDESFYNLKWRGETFEEAGKIYKVRVGIDHTHQPAHIILSVNQNGINYSESYRYNYGEETISLNTGDCEDFVIFFLYRMKQYGIPIERLGVCQIHEAGENKSHVVPTVQNSDGKWMMMQTFREAKVSGRSVFIGPGTPLQDLKTYIDMTMLRSFGTISVYSFHGLQEGATIRILTSSTSEEKTIEGLQEALEPKMKARGWSVE